MSEWQRFEAAREAQAEVTRRTGPTSERYSSALARYVAAVGDIAEHESGHRGTLSEELRWNIEQNLVRDVMTRRVVCVSEDATFKEIVDLLARHRISAVPVVDAELRVVGVVSESDLLATVVAGGDPRARIGAGHSARVQARRKSRAETAGELMNSPAVTTSPDTSVVHAARAAAMAYVRRLPVVDANATLVGIVARSDLLRVFLRDDEKIRAHLVGVLADQYCIGTVTVDVHDGVVTLRGQVERRHLITALVDAVRATAGVVGVHDNLTYRVDDRYLPPSPLY
jgi:CBS-domain-containing membrane protein